jgi:hypothetical protein
VLTWELEDKAGIAFTLRGLAATYGARRELEQAVRLYGLAEGVFLVSSRDMLPHERADHERAVASLRAQMGERSFAQAWAEGKAMALDKAIAYAIEVRAAA